MPALSRALRAASVAERLGSSLRPVPVIQKILAPRIAKKSSSSVWISRSGALGRR
ncbi:hypothetical protein SVIOM74S_01438 [Streptomyces violarus]